MKDWESRAWILHQLFVDIELVDRVTGKPNGQVKRIDIPFESPELLNVILTDEGRILTQRLIDMGAWVSINKEEIH